MPAKKTKKAARRGAKRTAKEPSVRKIKYRCSNGCKATPKFATMNQGDVVVLIAVNTDATINFLGTSPFESGTDPIHVPKGTAHPEVVASNSGTFEYTLSCKNPRCSSGVTNPEMIVP
jgi:hypothetical protein